MQFSNSNKLDALFLERPIAHRGLHNKHEGVLENSPSAFQKAITQKLPIELDVQETKDHRAVVFHDYGLSRLTLGRGKVKDFTFNEISSIPLRSNEPILSLEETFQYVDGSVPLLVEIKDQTGNQLLPMSGGFLEEIIELSTKYHGPLAIMSFNPYAIEYIALQAPELVIGLTTDNFFLWPKIEPSRVQELNQLTAVNIPNLAFISHNFKYLEQIKNINLPKLCWTITSQKHEIIARNIADNITFEGYDPLGLV